MNEIFKRRLFDSANRRARQLNFTFSGSVTGYLRSFIDQGVDRMSATDLQSEVRKNLAESNLLRLIDRLAIEARNKKMNEGIDTRTFSESRMSICPLWPFC